MKQPVRTPHTPGFREPTSRRCKESVLRILRRISVFGTVFGTVFGAVFGAAASAQELIYAEVQLPEMTAVSGTEFTAEIKLLNASGQEVPAPDAYAVVLEVRRGSREGDLVATYELEVPAGSSSATVALTLDEAGIMSLRALNDDLVAREAFVRVAEAGLGQREAPGWWWPGLAYAAPAAAPDNAPYRLDILYDAETPYLANGEDTAQINIFLSDASGQPTLAREKVKVRLVTNRGVLKPKEIVIPKGQDGTSVQLSAKRPGKVKLNYRGAIPNAVLATPELPPLTFAPNLLYITASPSRTSLLQPLELVIRLYDANGQPVPVNANRVFTVEIADGSAGRGVFKPAAQTTIEEGGFEARIKFVPNWVGRVLVSASTPNLQSSTVEIQVAMAFIWILLSLIGGALGSAVALLFGPKLPVAKRYARVFAGVIAGFMFFWALIYGILAVPSADLVLLNPISAVMVSVLGGYAGTSIFTLLLRSFGVNMPQNSTSREMG